MKRLGAMDPEASQLLLPFWRQECANQDSKGARSHEEPLTPRMSSSSSQCHHIPVCHTAVTSTPQDHHKTTPRSLTQIKRFSGRSLRIPGGHIPVGSRPTTWRQPTRVAEGAEIRPASWLRAKRTSFSLHERHNPLSKTIFLQRGHFCPTAHPAGLFWPNIHKSTNHQATVVTNTIHYTHHLPGSPFFCRAHGDGCENRNESGTGPNPTSGSTSATAPTPDLFYHTEHPNLPLSALHFTPRPAHTPIVLDQRPGPLPCQAGGGTTQMQEGG